jgi:hypothetical protein
MSENIMFKSNVALSVMSAVNEVGSVGSVGTIVNQAKFNFKFFSLDSWLAKGFSKTEVEGWEGKDNDAGVKTYQRPAVIANLTMPSFFNSLPDDTVQELVGGAIYDFVKSEYIDKNLPVGDHAWQTIVAETERKSESRGGSIVAWNEEIIKQVAIAVEGYFKGNNKSAMGALLAQLVTDKMTKEKSVKVLKTSYVKDKLQIVRNSFDSFYQALVANGLKEDSSNEPTVTCIERLLRNLDNQLKAFDVIDKTVSDAFSE